MAVNSRSLQSSSKQVQGHLAWKHIPPRRPELLLPREHLVRRLEQMLGERRSGAAATTCFVEAPAGYGKTTLLAQWAERTTIAVAWYHLDATDNDPVTCIHGLLRALRQKIPACSWETERFLGHLRSGTLPADEVRRAAAILSLDLQRNAKKPIALVLTGVSGLAAQEPGYQFIDELVSRPPDRIRLVLESREHIGFYVSTLLAQRRILGLGLDDLKLQPEEFHELVRRAHVRATARQLQQIEALCAGWITGVLLATGALRADFPWLTSSQHGDHERVVEYLAHEVIDRLPTEDRAFALCASVLDTMTPEVCADLLGIADARERLLALERRTGFITRVEWQSERAVYRFQPFLRQALLARLEAMPGGPELRRTLHKLAGDLLREQGNFEEAAQQYAQAGRYDELVALIEARKGLLLRAGNGMTLARWIQLLPATARARWPELEVLLAELHRLAGNVEEARKAARAASYVLAASDRFPELAARLAIVLGNIAFQDGNNHLASELSKRALELVTGHAGEIALSAGLLGVSAALAMEGPDQAQAVLAEVEHRCAGLRDRWGLAVLRYRHSKILLMRGDIEGAECAAAQALLLAQEAGDDVTAVNARLNLGATASQSGRPQLAREHFEQAESQAANAGYVRGQAYARVNLADLLMLAGDYAGAIIAYQETQPCIDAAGDVHLRAAVTSNLARSLIVCGRTTEAIELLEPEVAAFGARQHDLNWIELATSLGLAYLRAGQAALARVVLQEAVARADALHASPQGGRARLYRAAVELAGDPATAARDLSAALDVLQPSGTSAVRMELRLVAELSPLLAELHHPLVESLTSSPELDGCERNGTRDRCKSDWQIVAVAQAGPTDGGDGGPETQEVRLFALGEPRVLVGATQIKRWRKPGVRELLFFLAERGSATTQQVLAALWPDDPEERALAAFREARSRLKSALDIGECLAKENNRWRLSVKVTLDTQEFESLLEAGEQHIENGDLVSAAAAFRQAITCWAGPYLDDIYSDWLLQRREELLRRYLGGLERLADIELLLGRLDDAIQHFYQLLDADRYREASYRGLMRSFIQRGEIGKALDQYSQCLRALAEMNAVPSPETSRLAQALGAHEDALATLETVRELHAVGMS